MSPWHTPEPDGARIRDTALVIRNSTRQLDHEREAVSGTKFFDNPDDLFTLLALAEVLNLRLHKQLVEWHTRFPEKPTREESDRFWAELKQLREAKERLAHVEEAIHEQETRINTLATQVARSRETIADVERYFDGYLNRVNER